jgi:hypothetical protein
MPHRIGPRQMLRGSDQLGEGIGVHAGEEVAPIAMPHRSRRRHIGSGTKNNPAEAGLVKSRP